MSGSALDNVLSMLGDSMQKLGSSPEGRAVMKRFEEKEISLEEAAQQLFAVARKEGLLEDLREASVQVGNLAPGFALSPAAVKAAGRPVFMEPKPGVVQMNPVLEAALAERMTLDGDIPEIRKGLLPPGGKPAPWVKAETRDPVALGLMLEKASNEVLREMADAIEDHQAGVARLLEEAGRKGGEELARVQENLPPVPAGVKGYRAGMTPAYRDVEPPSPLVVAAMSPDMRRVAIYRVLSTTQGRTSAAPTIEHAIREVLEGALVPLAPAHKHVDPGNFSVNHWTMRVFGAEDVSDKFNPIQTAIDYLSEWALIQTACAPPKGGWALSAAPFNQGIADRRFGWTLTLGPPQEAS